MEHNRRRILFIDDDTEEVDVFRILLGPECEALHIDAPDQIERAMSEFLPDCVMIDHNLGTTTSLEVLAKLKAREYTGPVAFIILTGSNSLDLAVQCMRSGAHDFLVKGKLNRNEFNRAIERAMRNAELEFRIHRVAYYDTLTGALNRKSLWEKLEERLVRAEKTDNKFAVLNIDLDRFKYINDTFGHYFGDCVLSNVVSRTKTCLSSGDFIARTGGDEFLVLVNAGQSHSELLQLADRIRTGLTEPMKIDGKSVSVTPSVGIATYPDDGTTIDELINHSDVAMYAAKTDGKNRVRAFDEDLKSETDHRNMLEQALRQACDNEEFVVHYQPIVNELGEVVGLEALLRWQRPG
ncbi:MAG: diguanylate cyclase, partial [Leptospirales bacterium]